MESSLMLQFATETLDLNNKSAVISEIFNEITKLVNVSHVVGVQLIPKRWPHQVEILCANPRSKALLQEKGLTIQNKPIDLSEPGLGKVKVAVDDAPMNMDNNMIRDILSGYGKVLDVRNDYLHVGGNRVPWWNGTRNVDMCELKSELPPTLNVRHGHKEVKIKLWHLGHTHIECRWCKNHIIKDDHDCPKKTQRRCFNCGSTNHMKAECTMGKQCYNCGESSHIAGDCPNGRWDISNQAHFPPVSDPENSAEHPQVPPKDNTEPVQNLGPPCTDSPEARELDLENNVGKHSDVECLLLGSSNCRNLEISGDDDLRIQVASYVKGGMKIKDTISKLDEISKEKLSDFQTVILHVGSTDFPVTCEKDFETCYMQYVENLSELATRCPKAEILISSVLPRNENLATKTNKQIQLFNDKLRTLADEEPYITFVDNWSCLADGVHAQSSFYRKNDANRIHLNNSGKARLAETLQGALKETVFRNKLENEWQIQVAKPAPQ